MSTTRIVLTGTAQVLTERELEVIHGGLDPDSGYGKSTVGDSTTTNHPSGGQDTDIKVADF